MARTFIGELILRLKDEMSGKAKEAATSLDTSIGKIEKAAKRMNDVGWGGKFDEQIRKLGANSKDIDALGTSWKNMNKAFAENNLSKSMKALEQTNWKSAALSTFADISLKAKEADKNIRHMHSGWRDAMKDMKGAAKDMLTYGVAGGVLYGGVTALKGGVVSNAEFVREKSRWQQANVPDAERDNAIAESDRLTTKYPSAGLVNTVELARKGRAMMGTTERALAILPDLVRAFVALQSAKGPEAAVKELEGFLKGADVAGINSPGEGGIKAVREVLAGWVRAAQVEGSDIDIGKFLEFARYGKLAMPGLSNRFLAVTTPAISQDFGPSQYGNALNMAYKSFVIGSNNNAGKKNLKAQRDLGIRAGREDGGKGHLVNDQLFATDPYAWVQQVLVPALKKKGIDTKDAAAVNKEIAKLASNSNSTTVLSRMVTQGDQIDRLLQLYDQAKGLDFADNAAADDPFVAMKGFVESWRELATAIQGMPEAVSGLNVLTKGIQNFATALRNQDGLAQLGLAGAGAAGLFSAWKVTAGIWGLVTAGTNLNAAAVALEAAAVSLGGAGVLGDLPGKGKASLLGRVGEIAGALAPWISRFSLPAAAAVTVYKGLDSVPHAGIESSLKNNSELMIELANSQRRWQGVAFEGGMHRAGLGAGPRAGKTADPVASPYAVALDLMARRIAMEEETRAAEHHETRRRRGKWEPRGRIPVPDSRPDAAGNANGATAIVDLSAASIDAMTRRQQMEAETKPVDRNTPGLMQYFDQPKAAPSVDMSAISAAEGEAVRVGTSMAVALSITATPQVNVAALQQALSLANQLRAALAGVGPAIQQAHRSVQAEMNRSFADHGVTP